MKNLFTITDLAMDKSEEMITFTLQIKDQSELIPGRIKYELKKAIETELSSFSGLNDSHGYSEFTTLDLLLDAETMKLYDENVDQFMDINLFSYDLLDYHYSIKKLIIDAYSSRPDFDGWDAVCYVNQEMFEAVDEAVENNATTLLEGES